MQDLVADLVLEIDDICCVYTIREHQDFLVSLICALQRKYEQLDNEVSKQTR